MPFPKIPDSLKRVRLNTTISPECDRALRLLSEKSGLALGRIIDELILGSKDPVKEDSRSILGDGSFNDKVSSFSSAMDEARERVKRLTSMTSK